MKVLITKTQRTELQPRMNTDEQRLTFLERIVRILRMTLGYKTCTYLLHEFRFRNAA
jgi:hypothetical protein